ncbi:unnamed protein product [Rhodiola kirilowii]
MLPCRNTHVVTNLVVPVLSTPPRHHFNEKGLLKFPDPAMLELLNELNKFRSLGAEGHSSHWTFVLRHPCWFLISQDLAL